VVARSLAAADAAPQRRVVVITMATTAAATGTAVAAVVAHLVHLFAVFLQTLCIAVRPGRFAEAGTHVQTLIPCRCMRALMRQRR